MSTTTKTRTAEQKAKDAERASGAVSKIDGKTSGAPAIAETPLQARNKARLAAKAEVTSEPVGSSSVEAPEDRTDNVEAKPSLTAEIVDGVPGPERKGGAQVAPKPAPSSAITNQARKIVADHPEAKPRTYFIWDAGTQAAKADGEWMKVNGLGKAFAKDTQREQPTRGKYTSTKLTPAQAIALAERFEYLAKSAEKPGPLFAAANKLVREAVVNAKK